MTSPAPPAGKPPLARTSLVGFEHHLDLTTGSRLLHRSDGPAWAEVFIRVFGHQAVQETFLVPAVAEPMLTWVISGSAQVEERELGGSWSASMVNVGDFYLTWSEVPYELRWRAQGGEPFQVMHLFLSLAMLEAAFRECHGEQAASMRLQEISGAQDPELSRFLEPLRAELDRGARASAMFVDGLARALSIHLARNYALDRPPATGRNVLPGVRLRRAVDFMAANLQEPFDLAAVARAAGFSEFHFSRLFKATTGFSPSRYFIRQRILRARQLLLESDAPIIEIAMSVGYMSPGHFAQVFRRQTGLAPGEYRRR